jgi:putative transposase
VPYNPADWPADGIQPEQFLADQGEMASKNARRVSPGLRATVSNVPGLRPDWKPLVECGFKMTHQLISPDLPAYDPPSNQTRRRGKKYHGAASLTLEQFTALVVKAIVTHNRTMQVNFDLSHDQVSNGVRPIPTELWTYEARSRAGALSRFDADTVRMELLPREWASVTESGIAVADCLYTFPEAVKKGWFVQARRKRFEVVVSRDYRLCDKVLVHDPFVPGVVHEAHLVKACMKFAGMSFADVRRFVKAKDDLTKDAEQLRRQNQFEYHQHSQPIIAEGNAALKAATGGKPVSRNNRRKDTAPARGRELRREREEKAGVPMLMPTPPMTAPPPPRLLPAPMAMTPVANPEVAANRPLSLAEKAALQRKKLMACV